MERKWYVTYSYKSGDELDICTVWTEARSKEEAIDNVQDEYWDVVEIVDCYPA